MQQLVPAGGNPIRVLALGAHADDIEIGCGATVLRFVELGTLAAIHWVVFSALGERLAEARAGASAFTAGHSDVQLETHEVPGRVLSG